ncbi:MAG: glycosyltransferase [Bacteroidota bacterium]
MKLLVNALSVNNQSGKQVLSGHLLSIQRSFGDKVAITVLCRKSQSWFWSDFQRAQKIVAPESTSKWWTRYCWEKGSLSGLCRKMTADFYFTPSGIAAGHVPIPQIVLAQNPWCFIPEVHQTVSDCLKGFIQRKAYADTMRQADTMVFNSRFMRKAYRENARCVEKRGVIAFNGVSNELYREAQKSRGLARVDGKIVSVSVMASHKGHETLVEALGILRKKYQMAHARVFLIGSWPDDQYHRKIAKDVERRDLKGSVEFCGHVSFSELLNHYATAKVYCLLSHCESFGIPAAEAQVFGTPVVLSDVCAMPEVGGDGGLYGPPNDAEKIAQSLFALLSDNQKWDVYSQAARINAERFRWEKVSRPFIQILEELSQSLGEKIEK